jgi:hypothetical protein
VKGGQHRGEHLCRSRVERREDRRFLVGGTHLGGGSRMTVFAVLAAADARKLRATVSDGFAAARVRTQLEPVALRTNRAIDLRFAVIALSGKHCIERLATEGALGKALWQGTPPKLDCGYPPLLLSE